MNKQSEARKAWWAKQTPEMRKAHATKMAIAKSAKMTEEERRHHGVMMISARWNKRLSTVELGQDEDE